MSLRKELKIWNLSDIHFGHANTSTESIIENINSLFNNYKPNDIDVIFLSGDTFDRLLDFDDGSILPVVTWISMLADFARFNNIKIRVLKGTPSHDWNQSQIFEHYAEQTGKKLADIKYVDRLSVEYMEDLGLSVLYIPDEWSTSMEKTKNEAYEAVRDMNLTQVDLAIMHGCFNFQLPPAAAKVPRHNEEDYLPLVKHYVIIGHDHIHKTYERILVPGSVDRLKHGEENPKGFLQINLKPDGSRFWCFVENTNAKCYKTYEIKSKDLESALTEIERKTCKLPKHSFVRIRADKDHPVISAFNEVRKQFPDFTMSKITNDQTDESDYEIVHDLSMDLSGYVPITITPDNITGMLIDEITAKYPADHISRTDIEKVLADYI